MCFDNIKWVIAKENFLERSVEGRSPEATFERVLLLTDNKEYAKELAVEVAKQASLEQVQNNPLFKMITKNG